MAIASQQDNPAEVINLLGWHRGLHMITGSMALKFNRATPADLAEWARALKVIAAEMERVATPVRPYPDAEKLRAQVELE
jgi:hypothetical protein